MKWSKPWIMTVIGSILILASTFVSGYMVYGRDNQITDLSNQKQELERNLNDASREYDRGHLRKALSDISYMIVQFSLFQDAELQSAYLRIHASQLKVALLCLISSTGRWANENDDKRLGELTDLAATGDKNALIECESLVGELSVKSGKFRSDLILKVGRIEDKIKRLELGVNKIRLIAFVIQIVGLVILLIKEVPLVTKTTLPRTADSDVDHKIGCC